MIGASSKEKSSGNLVLDLEIKPSVYANQLNINKTSFCEVHKHNSIKREISHFSDHEDSEEEESKANEKIDILSLAERNDGMKASRAEQFQKMTQKTEQLNQNLEDYEEESSESEADVKEEHDHGGWKPVDRPSHSKLTQVNRTSNSDPTRKESEGDTDMIFEEEEQSAAYQPREINVTKMSQNMMKNKISTVPDVSEASRFTTFKSPFDLRNLKGSSLPEMEGYLKKKSPTLWKGFEIRYCILKDRKLVYYKNENNDTFRGCLNFNFIGAQIKMSRTSKKRFTVKPAGGGREFTFKAETEELAKKWFETIQMHIAGSDGEFMGPQNKLTSKREYWKTDRITEFEFLTMVDTGDLLLFRSKHVGAKIQRSFTRSQFDHVALLLKYQNGEIVLLEATGKQGVGLSRWRTFKKNNWHLLYSKMVYRKLEMDRSDDMITKIEKFVKNSIGKKYMVSMAKLFKKRSNFQEDIEENKTFFCSELIAACYKRLGVLPKDVSCASYWPGSFSCEKKLTLEGGASLSHEYLIDFSL
jgi:hypothetical protein